MGDEAFLDIKNIVQHYLGLFPSYALDLKGCSVGGVQMNTHAILQLAYDTAYTIARAQFPAVEHDEQLLNAFEQEWESALEWIDWKGVSDE